LRPYKIRYLGPKFRDVHPEAAQWLVAAIPRDPEHVLGNRVLSYRFSFQKGSPDVSVWLLQFFEHHAFIGFVLAEA
jgi:hypothetical protein